MSFSNSCRVLLDSKNTVAISRYEEDFHFLKSEVYLYIGITSLCLYNITGIEHFQDGMLDKVNKEYLCRIQIYTTQIQNVLTFGKRFGMLIMLGGLRAAFF